MSNIRSLRKAFPATAWKVGFAEALMQLQPAMNPDAADEASDEAFVKFEHLTPLVAAAAWVAGHQEPVSRPQLPATPGHDDDVRTAAV